MAGDGGEGKKKNQILKIKMKNYIAKCKNNGFVNASMGRRVNAERIIQYLCQISRLRPLAF
jgi:hypothetical protein